MRELLSTGRILDLVLAIVALEILIVIALRSGRRRSPIAPELLAHLVAAAGLLAAAHMVLAHAGWLSVGVCLVCALLGHVQALRHRLVGPRH
jgi:pheromone shutdown protein TraB